MRKWKRSLTGGAGFIGSNLVTALLDHGFDVHVIDNYTGGKRTDRIASKALYHDVDIRDYDAIAPIIASARYVFHEAALPRVQFSIEHPQESFSVNVDGLISVLRAAHEHRVVRVIYAASSSAYGDQAILPLYEDLPAQPKSPYGLQKYVGELSCRLWSEVYGLPTVSLRYFNVYGPMFDPNGDYALVIGKFLKLKREGKPLTITGDGTQTRDFTHVSDVVRANLLAAESSNVGRGRSSILAPVVAFQSMISRRQSVGRGFMSKRDWSRMTPWRIIAELNNSSDGSRKPSLRTVLRNCSC